jgi:hypothetical protein
MTMILRRASGGGPLRQKLAAALLPTTGGHARLAAGAVFLLLVTVAVVTVQQHRIASSEPEWAEEGRSRVHVETAVTLLKTRDSVIRGQPYEPLLKHWRHNMWNRSSLVFLPRHALSSRVHMAALCLEWRTTRCDNDAKDLPAKARPCGQEVGIPVLTAGYCYCRDGSRSAVHRDRCSASAAVDAPFVHCEDECKKAMLS